MNYAARIEQLERNAQNQHTVLKNTTAEIADLRALPPGTAGVPLALQKLNTERKRQQNTLATTQAHLGLLQHLQEKENENAKKQPKQTPK